MGARSAAVAASGRWTDPDDGIGYPAGEVHAWEPGRNETGCGLSLSRSRLTRFPHVGWADVQPESGRHAQEVQAACRRCRAGQGARRDEKPWHRTDPAPEGTGEGCVVTGRGGAPRQAADRPRPVFSRLYAAASERMDAAGFAALRTELLAPLAGPVVEVGAGNGRNFARYPAAVTSVTAVEPEPRLRALAGAAAAHAPVPVTVLPGTAGALPLPDGSCDAAVLCLVLCSVPDRAGALAELVRVLRPGGQLAFLEHGLGGTRGLRAVQRLADAAGWPLLAGGCHLATDPVGDIAAAGFAVTGVRRLRFPGSGLPGPATPHVLGLARRPG